LLPHDPARRSVSNCIRENGVVRQRPQRTADTLWHLRCARPHLRRRATTHWRRSPRCGLAEMARLLRRTRCGLHAARSGPVAEFRAAARTSGVLADCYLVLTAAR